MAGDTFQKFKASFNRGVTAISIKTSSSLEKVKIKTHIESINSEIERLVAAAGKTAYTLWESGNLDLSSLSEQFSMIKQKKEEIAQLETEYDSIDERGNQILGTQAPEEAVTHSSATEPMAGIICPNCGSNYTTPVKFCRKCGTKLTE